MLPLKCADLTEHGCMLYVLTPALYCLRGHLHSGLEPQQTEATGVVSVGSDIVWLFPEVSPVPQEQGSGSLISSSSPCILVPEHMELRNTQPHSSRLLWAKFD